MIVLFKSIVTIFVFSVSLVACSTFGSYEELAVDPEKSSEDTEFDYVSKLGEYLIGPEDTVSINVLFQTLFSVNLKVMSEILM